MVGIYKITSPSGRIYIGQSVDIFKRKKSYSNPKWCKSQIKLYKSILKYGWNTHIWEAVEECLVDDLNSRERYWQDFFDSMNSGLNCRLTTTTDKSGMISNEVKDKIAKSNSGRRHTQETKDKIRNIKLGGKSSNETRALLSKNHSRYNAQFSDEDIHIICKMYLSGDTSSMVRIIYPNVDASTLSEIRNKKRYIHITTLYDLKRPTKVGEKKITKHVLCIEDNLEFESIKDAGDHYGIDMKNVSAIALGTVKKSRINKSFIYV